MNVVKIDLHIQLKENLEKSKDEIEGADENSGFYKAAKVLINYFNQINLFL